MCNPLTWPLGLDMLTPSAPLPPPPTTLFVLLPQFRRNPLLRSDFSVSNNSEIKTGVYQPQPQLGRLSEGLGCHRVPGSLFLLHLPVLCGPVLKQSSLASTFGTSETPKQASNHSKVPRGPPPYLFFLKDRQACPCGCGSQTWTIPPCSPHPAHPPASLLVCPLPRSSPTSNSVCRQVPGPSEGATMSLVTGSLLGKLERQ